MSKEQNRQAMPAVAAFVDDMRSLFGEVRVTYACENGRAVGHPADPAQGVRVTDMVLGPQATKPSRLPALTSAMRRRK